MKCGRRRWQRCASAEPESVFELAREMKQFEDRQVSVLAVTVVVYDEIKGRDG